MEKVKLNITGTPGVALAGTLSHKQTTTTEGEQVKPGNDGSDKYQPLSS